MSYRFHGRAVVNRSNPSAWAACDRCGMLVNRRNLIREVQWHGARIANTGSLVCDECLDVPQQQLRQMTLPPDPGAIRNPRPEPYAIDETNFRITEDGQFRLTEDGDMRVTESG